jgi:hypothetical protein
MRYSPFALLPLLLVACTDQQPTAPDIGVAPAFAVAGNSGCYTVTINQQQSVTSPSSSVGFATGDVEATTSTVLDEGTFTAHGVAYGQEGLDTWNVTGGIIEEFIGEEITISHRSLLLWPPDNEPFVARLNGTARAADGLSKANATFHGTFDARVWPFQIHTVWNGVICP